MAGMRRGAAASTVGGDDARGGGRSVGVLRVGGRAWVGTVADRTVSGEKKPNIRQWGMHPYREGDSRGRYAALCGSPHPVRWAVVPWAAVAATPSDVDCRRMGACVAAGGRPRDNPAAQAVPCHRVTIGDPSSQSRSNAAR